MGHLLADCWGVLDGLVFGGVFFRVPFGDERLCGDQRGDVLPQIVQEFKQVSLLLLFETLLSLRLALLLLSFLLFKAILVALMLLVVFRPQGILGNKKELSFNV